MQGKEKKRLIKRFFSFPCMVTFAPTYKNYVFVRQRVTILCSFFLLDCYSSPLLASHGKEKKVTMIIRRMIILVSLLLLFLRSKNNNKHDHPKDDNLVLRTSMQALLFFSLIVTLLFFSMRSKQGKGKESDHALLTPTG